MEHWYVIVDHQVLLHLLRISLCLYLVTGGQSGLCRGCAVGGGGGGVIILTLTFCMPPLFWGVGWTGRWAMSPPKFKIFLIFPYFVRQLVRQLLYQVFYTRYHFSFYLWLIGSVLKHCKIPKYYDHDCRFQ